MSKKILNYKNRIISIMLTMVLLLGMVPASLVAYAQDEKVRVVVENTTYSVEEGAAWDGTLVDTWVSIDENSTMTSAIVEALNTVNATQTGAESDYITEINGLCAGSYGGYDGWVGTLNDWFTNEGFGAYTVADNTLEAGDEIRMMYSLNMGEDLGGTWSNNLTTVKQVVFSTGTLDKDFSQDVQNYVLTVPNGTEGVLVTPTATNKNFQVHIYAGEDENQIEYKRSSQIPIVEGTVITVECGNPEWPTMNGYGLQSPTWEGTSYQFEVKIEEAANPAQALLESLIIHSGTSPESGIVLVKNEGDIYEAETIFDSMVLTYQLTGTLTDNNTQLRFRAKPAGDTDTATLLYEGGSKDITWTSGSSKWANFLSGGVNEFQIQVTSEDEEILPTTYNFSLNVIPTLTDLLVQDDKVIFNLDRTFQYGENSYVVTVPDEQESITVQATPRSADYEVTYNGSTSNQIDITNLNAVEIKVVAGGVQNVYTLQLNRVEQLDFQVETVPQDAVVKVYDNNGREISKNADGTYSGMFGAYDYTYTVSKYGYVTKKGIVPENGGTIRVTLEKAADSGIEEVDAFWSNYYGNNTNMAITDVHLPQSEDLENISLKWNQKFGTGWSASPSVQIIVDNGLIVMCDKAIYKLDLQTGEILAQGTMTAAPSWGYMPPTYGEGMIFCPLSNGTIQAFNAKTLESVWIYKDNLKGQSLAPITYSDGYIYTGFWNGETKDANFVCISVTDEDITSTEEEKLATWKHTQAGGFYWAGSVVVGDTVIVGTDDGASGFEGTGNVYSFNKFTGEIISHLRVQGDQRSSMAYDKENHRIFFTTKAGCLYRMDINPETGVLSNLQGNRFNAQTTSTPVVYKGLVFFGTGSGITANGSSGNFVVADADTLEMVAAAELKGYPQCSMLMTNAYEKSTGYLYFYSTYNAQPGGITTIKVKADCKGNEDVEVTELYDAEGFSQFCISNIICGPDGTLYYKNDSCNVLAVGVPSYINVIKFIDEIGTVTLDSRAAIQMARDAYNALSLEEREKVTNYSKLLSAEETYRQLVKQQEEEKDKDKDKDKGEPGNVKPEEKPQNNLTQTQEQPKSEAGTQVNSEGEVVAQNTNSTETPSQDSSLQEPSENEEDAENEASDDVTAGEVQKEKNPDRGWLVWLAGTITGAAVLVGLSTYIIKMRKEK